MTSTDLIQTEALRDRDRGIAAFVIVAACGKAKVDHPTRARDLYTGDLTRKQIDSASRSGRFLILSAEHGLLDPDTIVDPYDRTMTTMPAEARREWAVMVIDQLLALGHDRWHVVCWAGNAYLAPLRAEVERRGLDVRILDRYSDSPSSLTRQLGHRPEIGERKQMFARSAARRATAFRGTERVPTTET